MKKTTILVTDHDARHRSGHTDHLGDGFGLVVDEIDASDV